jgi:hypothetical protein
MDGFISKIKAPQKPPVIVTNDWTSLYHVTIANTGIERIMDQIPFTDLF